MLLNLHVFTGHKELVRVNQAAIVLYWLMDKAAAGKPSLSLSVRWIQAQCCWMERMERCRCCVGKRCLGRINDTGLVNWCTCVWKHSLYKSGPLTMGFSDPWCVKYFFNITFYFRFPAAALICQVVQHTRKMKQLLWRDCFGGQYSMRTLSCTVTVWCIMRDYK